MVQGAGIKGMFSLGKKGIIGFGTATYYCLGSIRNCTSVKPSSEKRLIPRWYLRVVSKYSAIPDESQMMLTVVYSWGSNTYAPPHDKAKAPERAVNTGY